MNNNETKTKNTDGPTLAQTVRDDLNELSASERAAIITAADVVAFLTEQCREVRVRTGCDTVNFSAHLRQSETAPHVDMYYTAHAWGVCEIANSCEDAIAGLERKTSGRAVLAASKRAEAAKLLAEAEALAPETVNA